MRHPGIALIALLLVATLCGCTTEEASDAGTSGYVETSAIPTSGAPSQAVRLVFIHHSVGEFWLSPEWGGLLGALNANHYYVTDTNYGWGPDAIGDRTDIGDWYDWFLGPSRNTYLNALYQNDQLTYGLENSIPDPGGENAIIMFKSCFVGAGELSGNPGDPPRPKGQVNPVWGHGTGDDDGTMYTVANVKGLYRDLLDYFATRPDKFFVLVTTPPSYQGSVSSQYAANLRAVNNWLVEDWLDGYPLDNVLVFDFSCVLTSNGGNPNVNDLGAATGSHHRLHNGQEEHLLGNSPYLAYPTYDGGWDNHPTQAGLQKATAEFLALLNHAYQEFAE